MSKKKIMLVFGTRPEAIKMAPLAIEMNKDPHIDCIIAVTGQHREMLDQVLEIFDIKPHYDLNIMKPGQDLYDVSSAVLLGMRKVLKEAKPDFVLVHGDTATSTMAALAAFYQQIPVGHVEAGLRTFDKFNPWPEEVNRNITAKIADIHFAPTSVSETNLLNEGICSDNIVVTGNTVIDALHLVIKKIHSDEHTNRAVQDKIKSLGYNIERLDEKRRLVLITGHRRENFGEGLENICFAIKSLAEKYPNYDFLYPMHLNPNVRRPINEIFANKSYNNVFFVEPLDYLPFLFLMEKAYLILTDSGGIQEEAPSLGKPVLVMRSTTERPEAVEAGTVKLVGTDCTKLIDSVSELIENEELYNTMSQANNPYGDGNASKYIIEKLLSL